MGSTKDHIDKTKELQRQALKTVDYVLCRSKIDKDLAIELGANPEKIDIYNGGIYVKDFVFKPRLTQRHKLVFLGHLFYPPNENAVKLMVDKILPKLSSNFTLTMIGIGPDELINKYQSEGVDNISEELLEYDIALAPLFEGSGTRLKVLDYLASGMPTISISIGVEGLNSGIIDCLQIEDNIDLYAKRIEETSHNLVQYLIP